MKTDEAEKEPEKHENAPHTDRQPVVRGGPKATKIGDSSGPWQEAKKPSTSPASVENRLAAMESQLASIKADNDRLREENERLSAEAGKRSRQARRAKVYAPREPPVPEGMVRVRVRDGKSIKMDRTQSAEGGQWIDVDPAEMKAPAFRASVETEDDINLAEEEAASEEKAKEQDGSALFDSFRGMALDGIAVRREREAAQASFQAEVLGKDAARSREERGLARALLAEKEAPLADDGMAKPLLRPGA